MVGGTAGDVDHARPLLERMGNTIVHCGPRGAGIRTKLVNNYLSIVSNVVVAEALAIAEGAGLDRDIAIEVLIGTTAGRGHLGTTYPAKVLAGVLEPGFMVDLAHKDLGLALQMSADAGTSRSMGVLRPAVLRIRSRAGHGPPGLDRHLQPRTGVGRS